MPTLQRSPRTRGRRDASKASKPRRRGSTSTAKSKTKPKKSKKKKAKPVFTAKTSDAHELYQLSVQSPEEDVRFLSRVYKKVRGKTPLHFREDFCGTGFLSAHWIKRGKQYTAEGFDIDADRRRHQRPRLRPHRRPHPRPHRQSRLLSGSWTTSPCARRQVLSTRRW